MKGSRGMMRSYTVRLNPTRRQRQTLDLLLDHLCELYNAALQERRDAWITCQKSIRLYEQQCELTQLRAVDPESAEFPVAIQRDPLRRVQRAFDGFFRRMKAKQEPGYPRFRSAQRYDSFMVGVGNFRIDGETLTIVKLGGFRFRTRCRIKGTAKAVHVRRVGERWRAVITCDIGPAPDRIPVSSGIGIDVGLKVLATLSNGDIIENPRWTEQEAGRLARANRQLSSKQNGSRNRAKARERLRRVHQRIQGLRRGYLYEQSRNLLAKYDLIAFEKLDIRGLVQMGHAKSILDAAWGELIRILTYKAEEAGKWAVPVNPRGTTQRCSGCGVKVPKTLRERHHSCPNCGLLLDRDHNAAINIFRLGESLVHVGQNEKLRDRLGETEVLLSREERQ